MSEKPVSMKSVLLRHLARHRPWEEGEPLLAAVSGGADSTALLHLLRDLRPGPEPALTVVHLDHRIRGARGAADAAWVEALAAELGLPFLGAARDCPRLARESGISLEEAGRRARLDFFALAAAETGAKGVVLAHHADDQAETVLHRLLRGSGPAGLGGMRPSVRIGETVLYRPLLGVRRESLRQYLREENLSFRSDPSNRDRRFFRNRIRHDLIPLLENEWSPVLSGHLCRLAVLEAQREDFLRAQAAAAGAFRSSGKSVILAVPILRSLAPALRGAVLALALERAGLERPSHRHFQALERLLDRPSGSRTHLAGGLIARLGYGELELAPREAEPGFGVYPLSPGTVLTFPGFSLEASCSPGASLPEAPSPSTAAFFRSPPGTSVRAWFPIKVLRSPLILRPRQSGDRYRPLGRGGRKVSDILIDERLPRELRSLPLVFEDARGVAGLLGGRVDERFSLRRAGGEVLEVLALRT